MMKYKVGDKVRVRKNLAIGSYYGREKFVENMKSFIGKAVTVSKVSDAGYMILEDGGYAWTDEMFEGLVEETQPDETVKLYTWQDLSDYEILLHEKWRIANEQCNEQGQELSVMHTLRQEYMEAIKMTMDKLGCAVPASKAKELGFEVK